MFQYNYISEEAIKLYRPHIHFNLCLAEIFSVWLFPSVFTLLCLVAALHAFSSVSLCFTIWMHFTLSPESSYNHSDASDGLQQGWRRNTFLPDCLWLWARRPQSCGILHCPSGLTMTSPRVLICPLERQSTCCFVDRLQKVQQCSVKSIRLSLTECS